MTKSIRTNGGARVPRSPAQDFALPEPALPEPALADSASATLPDTNPFASRYVRPGAIPFVFPDADHPETLIDRLRQTGWRGQIVGPHGSGKSTLLATLLPALKQAGKSVTLYRLADQQRYLPARADETLWNSQTLVVVDGYEQLNWWSRWRLNRRCRSSHAGLLVTTHRDAGMPTIYSTTVHASIARELVQSLLRRGSIPLPDSTIERALASHPGNLREALFELYDGYERARKSDKH